VVEEETRGEPIAAQEGARRVLGERVDAARAAREINEEDAAAVALHERARGPEPRTKSRYSRPSTS
jgi:hypothetical protein